MIFIINGWLHVYWLGGFTVNHSVVLEQTTCGLQLFNCTVSETAAGMHGKQKKITIYQFFSFQRVGTILMITASIIAN